MNLLPRHQLVINDDIEKFNGATSHDIRDHFNAWVTDQLSQIVASPEVLERLQSDGTDQLGPELFLGTRYSFCLFVDDFCLESLEHFTNPVFDPVIKILSKPWGNLTSKEREYQIHPEWHDVKTDDEFTCWMDVYSNRHLQWWYDTLEVPADWDAYYVRPPMMFDGNSILDLQGRLASFRRQS